MRKKIFLTLAAFWFISCFILCGLRAFAQVAQGGTYVLEQSVVANGGNESTGGTFGLVGTIGQAVAGTQSSSELLGVRGGFWQAFLETTAAHVSISGRALTSSGLPISNAQLTLIEAGGETKFAITSPFGYYRFGDIESGRTYILTIKSKIYVFENSPRVVTVNDEIANLDFIGSR